MVVQPLEVNFSLKDKVYDALKQAIMSMNIYASREELRLDERELAHGLGVSRTPIREAITRLEQEGFVRVAQRKGVFVVRKTKREILDMIVAWAALESMAARLITLHAQDEEINTLRTLFGTFGNDRVEARIDEYSDTNILFHQKILQMSQNELINQMADNLFAHMRSIRHQTIGEDNRAERSIIDHMHIIEALESRNTDLAERLVRQHSLDLAAHVEKNVHYLD
ncbi:MAG: GntR family transcriptional regulator [SAR324 cluster bacterium]|nr:GntR family transcriptional regulator [SAR324 cluster bacterium]MCZ6532036.1 GntR family transcriptional regulator [SAR324 cluster bacterium]MCZ6559085.1 GntR family transcriptional regulator [SAR324 cluster bacterium]